MNSSGKEGSGFSPLRDGYRWSKDGHLLPRRNEEPFVPLGDTPYRDGEARIHPTSRVIEPRPCFELDYAPLLASEREARRRLLYPWRLLQRELVTGQIDPFVARELARQESRDKQIRDELEALLGKGADWRTALLLEAHFNDYARMTLGNTLASVFTHRPGEKRQWDAAYDAIVQLKRSGPAKYGKALALLFVAGCRVKEEPLPTRGEILDFLKQRGINVRPGNAARDIFTGPILSRCPRSRSGRRRNSWRSRPVA